MTLRLPANMPLLISGIIRRRGDGFVLAMPDWDDLRPITHAFPLTAGGAEMQAQIEEHLDQAVTLQGRWQPSPTEPSETGFLQVTALLKQPAAVVTSPDTEHETAEKVQP